MNYCFIHRWSTEILGLDIHYRVQFFRHNCCPGGGGSFWNSTCDPSPKYWLVVQYWQRIRESAQAVKGEMTCYSKLIYLMLLLILHKRFFKSDYHNILIFEGLNVKGSYLLLYSIALRSSLPSALIMINIELIFSLISVTGLFLIEIYASFREKCGNWITLWTDVMKWEQT